MTFLWPSLLWLLALLPLLVVGYLLILRRNRKAALRYAHLGMVRDAFGPGQWLRRHLPPLMFLLALAALAVAVARPTAVVTLPSNEKTIVLALDISGSMRAGDVQPTRLAAAQQAARTFIAEQPTETRIGIVTFAATASVVQAPTRDREALTSAIDRLQLQYGTAIGSGLAVSLATLFPDAGIEVRGLLEDQVGRMPAGGKPRPEPVPPGSEVSNAVILLSDGQSTTGPDPIEAARLAADLGVRVYTVGVGTLAGEVLQFEGWSMRVRLDEDTLKQIANMTRGDYYHADNAEDLTQVYRSLNTRLVFKTEQTEISAIFAAAGAALALLAGLLSLAWFNRIL
ncbi:MAG: VWA domain-containing protein [Rhodocyclaceae bacterium]